MLKSNVDLILQRIRPSDIVLDIGSWAQPFTRADYVIDIMPYETRAIFGSFGPEKEFFTKDTWIIHDVSSRKPLPFRDKEIDFVVCSHTLEDIRDPIHLCSEIIRVGKKGYIEVPSRIIESIHGFEGSHYTGYYHHRWLVEIQDSEMVFRFKPHLIHDSWKYHLPKSYLKKMKEEEAVSYFFWENAFQYKEVIQISQSEVARELENFVRKQRAYSSLFYWLEEVKPKKLAKRIITKSASLKRVIEKIMGRNISALNEEPFWSGMPEYYST